MLGRSVDGLARRVATRLAITAKAGSDPVVAQDEAFIHALAERYFYLGELGASTKMKLITNMMACVHGLLVAEVPTLGARLAVIRNTWSWSPPMVARSITFANKAPSLVPARLLTSVPPISSYFRILGACRGIGECRPRGHATSGNDSRLFDIADASAAMTTRSGLSSKLSRMAKSPRSRWPCLIGRSDAVALAHGSARVGSRVRIVSA